MIRFSIFGIPVQIEPWFWLTMAFFGGILGATNAESTLYVALFVIAGFVSILVHELGHALTGRAFGAPTRIVLHSFGGYATFPAGRFSRGQNLAVTAAGPAIQIVLGVLALAILRYAPLPTPAIQKFFTDLGVISIFWAILNLIPVIPLDGGQLVAAFLGPRKIRLALQISIVTATIAAAAMLFFLKSILFPLFLGLMAYQNFQALKRA